MALYLVNIKCVFLILSERVNQDEHSKDVLIVAVDLQAMAPIPGVINLQGDITKV